MSEWIPQKTIPSSMFPWWIRTESGGVSPCILGNPLYEPGCVLSNCVGWAWGRYQQGRGSVDPRLPASNAGNWYRQAQNAGMSVGSEPALGAVLCLSTHVCIVEEIAPDGSYINCSESDWGGAAFSYRTRYRSNNWILTGGTFQGFIYNDPFDPGPDPPEPGPDPGPTPPAGSRFKWWMARKILEERRKR